MPFDLTVISGGQTGADIAGLWVAALFGIKTGGCAPKGWMTLNGSKPNLRLFNLRQHVLGYAARTEKNVEMSDITIICSSVLSAGTNLTIRCCNRQGKPYCLYRFKEENITKALYETDIRQLVGKIRRYQHDEEPVILNIAGNSSDTTPSTFEFTFKLLYQVFSELGYTSNASMEDYIIYRDNYEEISIQEVHNRHPHTK